MKKDIQNGITSTVRSLPSWISIPILGLVFSAGIISILSSSDQDIGTGAGAIWEYDLGVYKVNSSPAVGDDGTIYIGTGTPFFDHDNDVLLENNNLYAINPDGSLKWRYLTGGAIHSSPAIGSTGTIYVGSADGYLYAIYPNGSLKWRYDTGDTIWSSPALASDESIYVGSVNAKLYAINPGGSLKPNWPYVAGGSISSSPAIGCDGTIYVGSSDGNLYAINPDGTLKPNWPFTANSSIRSSPAIGSDGTIYVLSLEGDLYAINPDGSIKPNWPYDTSTVDWEAHHLPPILSSPAIGSDGTIYVGSVDGKFYAINPDGSLKLNWPYNTREGPLDNAIVASSPAIGNDGTIYVGDNDLYALNPDGTAKYVYDLPDIESSPVIGSNGILYFASDGYLMAMDVASNRLADTPWPMFRHDAKHTGREASIVDDPANAIAMAGDSQVIISWDPGSGGASYNIYWSSSPGVTTSDSKITGASNPYIHTGLTNDVTYYYAVTAENSCGESALSNEVSATPVSGGAYAVIISPGDGTTVNMCPATTIFTANVTGGDIPYSYSWNTTTTAGAGFNVISSADEQTFEVCAWDSMTEGTIDVTVTDFNSQVTTDSINVDAL